jgi:hypothetical protein
VAHGVDGDALDAGLLVAGFEAAPGCVAVLEQLAGAGGDSRMAGIWVAEAELEPVSFPVISSESSRTRVGAVAGARSIPMGVAGGGFRRHDLCSFARRDFDDSDSRERRDRSLA